MGMQRTPAFFKAASHVVLALRAATFFQQFKHSVRTHDAATAAPSAERTVEQTYVDSETVRTLKFLVLSLVSGVALALLLAWDFRPSPSVRQRDRDQNDGVRRHPDWTATSQIAGPRVIGGQLRERALACIGRGVSVFSAPCNFSEKIQLITKQWHI
jgi:hypothetical protein